jgi:4-amino-4-deoxy-L-arabinose transferase-like glycosyltransferase
MTASRSQIEVIDGYILCLLGLAAIVLYSLNLGELPLRDWDEATYAIVAREMLQSGHWLHPTLGGQPFLFKPPLSLWLIAASYQLFGVNEWSTRLPLALLSALAIPLLYAVGRELFVRRSPALLSALVLLTLLPMVRQGRLAMMDGCAISFYLLLLLSLLRSRRSPLWGAGVGLSLGLLLLTKGILGILLGAISVLFVFWAGEWGLLANPYLWSGLAVAAIPVLSWYIAQGIYYGNQFWQIHFLNQSFDRVWDSVDGNTGPPWYYLQQILEYTWPWLIWLPGGLWICWQNRSFSWAKLILVGNLIFLGVISCMKTKLPWYLMPIYPFLALAVGVQLGTAWENQLSARAKSYPKLWFGLLGLLGIAVFVAGGLLAWFERRPLLLLLGLILSLTMAIAAFWVWKGDRRFMSVLLVGLYLGLSIFLGSNLWLWELNEAFPVAPVAQLIRTQTPANAIVYTSFAYSRPSLDFYSQRTVIALKPEQLIQLDSTRPFLLLDLSLMDKIDSNAYTSLGTAENFTLIALKSVKIPDV